MDCIRKTVRLIGLVCVEKNRKLVDVNEFKRKESYTFFSQFDKSYYAITTEVCVDSILNYIKKYNNNSFYCIMNYLLLKSCMQVENFCYRREMDKIYVYNHLSTSCTVMREDDELDYTNQIKYFDSLELFSKEFHDKKKEAVEGKKHSDLKDSTNLIYVTTTPWFRMKMLNSVRCDIRDDTIPRFSWGKYFHKSGHTYIDLTIEISHLFIDGYHISLFLHKLEKAIDQLI